MDNNKAGAKPLLNGYDFGKLSKSEMISYLNELGVDRRAFTTKVTRSELGTFYDHFKGLLFAISLHPPTEDMHHMDVEYRQKLVKETGQSYDYWRWNYGSIKRSRVLSNFILETKAKLDRATTEEAIKPVSGMMSREEYDSKIQSTLPITVSQLAQPKPEDELTRVFKYLSELSSDSNAEITIVFKPTI